MNRTNREFVGNLTKELLEYKVELILDVIIELEQRLNSFRDIEKREKILMESVLMYQYQVDKLKEQLNIESDFHDSMQENLVNQHIEMEKKLRTKINLYEEAIQPIENFFKINVLKSNWSIWDGEAELSERVLRRLVDIKQNNIGDNN